MRRGYRVLERNYTIKAGEIDAIAVDGETLCFLEIKARSGARYGPAVGAVTRKKARRIARVAAFYRSHADWRGPCRFDVLGLDRRPDGEWRYTLIRDAFRAEPAH